jgi:ABC-type nitrate/sulfonate/bicarbonate transport system ATPase subunit
MVTHDIVEAFTLGTRVLALDKRRHRSARAAPLRRDRGLRFAAHQQTAAGRPRRTV